VVHLVAVGQSAGELPEMLEALRQDYETEVSLALSRFTAAIEPLLIVVIAVGIGFVILATILPILDVTRMLR
jgi:type II secretory pathway component PulF